MYILILRLRILIFDVEKLIYIPLLMCFIVVFIPTYV